MNKKNESGPPPAPLEKFRQRYTALKQELQSLGFVCVGSVQTRYLECGQAACRCHRIPALRHGPYPYWTRKVKGLQASRTIRGRRFLKPYSGSKRGLKEA
jgi:hypothetical protein